ncbi:MAG TPA: DUF1987 domain-containing protein [Methanospirillum sp.]|nr:DUF1987 domain-containing protein [Methanospirillum sp.]
MINIPATKSSPRVFFSEEEKIFTISGESYPENTFAFFEPIFSWLHLELPRYDDIRFVFNISYLNSSSTKCILDMLDLLGAAEKGGCRVSVVWYYEAENERALDIAQEFEEDVEIPFEIIPLELPHPSE